MKEIIRFSDIRVSVSRSDVLKLMECGEDNPIYEEVVEEYEELKDALYSLGKPQALFCFDRISEEWAMEKAACRHAGDLFPDHRRRRDQRAQHCVF